MQRRITQKPHADQSGFQPYKSEYRKTGTGDVYQINDHLWEGKYSPRDAHGKRISRNVYAKTKEECEEKLAALIAEMKTEIVAEKEKLEAKYECLQSDCSSYRLANTIAYRPKMEEIGLVSSCLCSLETR